MEERGNQVGACLPSHRLFLLLWMTYSVLNSPNVQASAQECHANFSGSSGSFSTPGYPDLFPFQRWASCEWRIEAPGDKSIQLNFTDMIFVKRKCHHVHIEVRDGLNATADRLVAPCGNGSFGPIQSTGNHLFVTLVNRGYETGNARFQASWQTACDRILRSPKGLVQSPGFPSQYPTDQDCTFVIDQPLGYKINLQFTDFNMDAESNGDCLDYVTVYDGGSDRFPVLGGPYCGQTLPSQLRSTRNTVFLKFHSDSQASTSAIGFNATYDRVTPECRVWDGLPPSGNITSPGFPEPFPFEANCTWKISAPRGFVIDFTFNEIELGYDTNVILDCDSPRVTSEVSLFDGSEAMQDTLLARYCRRNVVSPVITTTGNSLTVVFHMKNLGKVMTLTTLSASRTGFTATYSSRNAFTSDTSDSADLLLPFGQYSRDAHLNQSGSLISRTHNLKIDGGFAIGDEVYGYVHIFQDGRLSFSETDEDIVMRTGSQSSCGSRRHNELCVYCTRIDNGDRLSDIFFNIYKENNRGVFDKAKELVNKYKGSNEFMTQRAVIVTWSDVRHVGNEYDGRATFQIVVAASDTETYGILLYDPNGMKWNFNSNGQPNIDIGYTYIKDGSPVCEDLAISRSRSVLRANEIQGNIGLKGTWIFKLGAVPENQLAVCEHWYTRNNRNTDHLRQEFGLLPQCPCNIRVYALNDIQAFGIWIPVNRYQGTRTCYRLSRSAGGAFYPHGKECCYESYTLIQDKPGAGSATAYNPSFPELYDRYTREDKEGYDSCCVNSNSTTHCDKYYSLRPIGECASNPPFRRAWLCCDPHITTLDEGEYVFNGWGEYTMVNLNVPGLLFVLQARTDLARNSAGQTGNGTVFSAFGAEENGIRVFVGLETISQNSLIVYGNWEDPSQGFSRITDSYVDEETVFLSRNTTNIDIAFPSGITFAVSVRQESLSLALSIPVEHRNKTRGLLGNFNGIKDDDFILPDGTMIGPNLTERHIYQEFGPAWAVLSANDSVMWYRPGEGPHTYSHPDFVPVFLDEQQTNVLNEAATVCGDNMACKYDYIATGSEMVALDSKSITEIAAEGNTAARISTPQLAEPPTLQVLTGTTANFDLSASGGNGGPLTYHAEEENDMVQVDRSTGTVTYAADANTPVQMRFFTQDSQNVRSPPRAVEVLMCTGCNGHGTCDYTTVRPADNENFRYSFSLATCICERGWDGMDCELDRDGCAADPCLEGQVCRDLTPQEQGNSLLGFDCGSCPPGYVHEAGYWECLDIDECEDATDDCQMTCTNIIGSYECGCLGGYRLNVDGRTCRDINECQEKTHTCDHICNNTDGGYVCSCEQGYTLRESDNICTQDAAVAEQCTFSECSQGCRLRDEQAGDDPFECFCFAGYDNATDDASECVDHDECQDGICGQQCFNFDGGFICACNVGYLLADDRVTCLPCSAQTYGPNCQYTCNCRGRAQECDNVRGCICLLGWEGVQCQEDVDECSENKGICGSDQECLNTPGSYTCQCRQGYTRDTDGLCIDIDECSVSSQPNACGMRQSCTNIPGSFHCNCNPGYSMENDRCIDIDECSLGIGICQHKCLNVLGSYFCGCFNGYLLNSDGAICSPVSDVCTEEGVTCDHGCTRVNSSTFVCFCNLGYSLQTDGRTCSQIVNCSNAGCSHMCSMINNRPVCSCGPGSKLDNSNKTCIECPVGTYGSGCTNLCMCSLGATGCDVVTGCQCRQGWTGESCDIDIDQCNNVSAQRECQEKQAVCKNTPGSYRCSCADGYSMNNEDVCQDINECQQDLCDQQCENNPGSFRCMCSRGFTMDSTTQTCIDIDECAFSATNLCAQTCINTAGSYLCDCYHPGFAIASDLVSCIAMSTCSRSDCPPENGGCREEQCFCNSGYQLLSNNTCAAIERDWCAEGLCDQDCQRTQDGRSFICSCGDGYLLDDNMRTCRVCPSGTFGSDCLSVCACHLENSADCDPSSGTCICKAGWEEPTCDADVNECSRTDACPQSSSCFNTAGSYVCLCDRGFLKELDGSCTACSNGFFGDNCAHRCNCTEDSHICDPVDGVCSCRAGWDGPHCASDVDECVLGTSGCEKSSTVCVNTVGSFRCECRQGYSQLNTGACEGPPEPSKADSLTIGLGVGIAVAVVVIVIIIVVIVVCVRRRGRTNAGFSSSDIALEDSLRKKS